MDPKNDGSEMVGLLDFPASPMGMFGVHVCFWWRTFGALNRQDLHCKG